MERNVRLAAARQWAAVLRAWGLFGECSELEGACSVRKAADRLSSLIALQEYLSSVARSSDLREARNFYVKSLDFQMLTFLPALKLWLETSLNLFLQTHLCCTLAEGRFEGKHFSSFWVFS